MRPLRFLLLCAACLLLAGMPTRGATVPATKPVRPLRHLVLYTPGELAKMGWTIRVPPYSYDARALHEQGVVYLDLTTDASGKITRAATADNLEHLTLDLFMAKWTRNKWRGPPNQRVMTYITFRLVN